MLQELRAAVELDETKEDEKNKQLPIINGFVVHSYTKKYEDAINSVSSNDIMYINTEEEMVLERNGTIYKVSVDYDFSWSEYNGCDESEVEFNIYEKSNGEEYTEEENSSIAEVVSEYYG